MGQDHVLSALLICHHKLAVKLIVVHALYCVGASLQRVEISPQVLFDLPFFFLFKRLALRLGDLVSQIHAASAGSDCRR